MVLQRPDTMTEAVSKHMRDAIVRGDYAPARGFPRSLWYSTSRVIVREALRMLADVGWSK